MDPISLLNWTPIVTIRRSVAVDQACLQLSGRSTLGQSAQNRFSIALIAVKAYGVLILRSIWIPRSMVLFHVSSATACTRSVRGVANPVDSPTQLEMRRPGPYNYVLITAAYNEEAHIEKTIQSVVSQTLRPLRWVIVSDNSQDRTDEIIQSHTAKHDFIQFLRVNKPAGHSFVSKVVALRKGAPLLEGLPYEFIGNLDADLSLDPDYYQQLLAHFQQNPDLGLVGGFVYEDHGTGFRAAGLTAYPTSPMQRSWSGGNVMTQLAAMPF